MEPFWTAVALTSLAGAATIVGGALGALGRPVSDRALAAALGLAAGVMLTVGAVEMGPAAARGLATAVGDGPGVLAAGAAVGGGALAYLLIDRLLPEAATPSGSSASAAREARVGRLGVATALAIGAHNLPEGFVTFAGALEDSAVGLALAVAMAVHNVPEGIAVSVPVRRATGSARTGFLWAATAGILEPAGALLGYWLLRPLLTDAVLGGVYGAVTGVMAALSLAALLPGAVRCGGVPTALAGAAAGAAAMLGSLSLLA
ncbi:ZIP family metal transporter [Micrococcus porci]|uniref:ZIP family metal transporter n=1 Tax=Micrococcus TaxID=1269 RepID=UPI001CCBC41F|nr:ZIP family metal transporter [Micrococcus porci]MCG7421791.1 ZIP family metal transporter [Micrococcus sp. ACRRV]UBH25770.1 ZIP family metal transporter [Micrococcus porci]